MATFSVHPASRRFRALYRRNSSHNSFLVTERCNHYCLMCSQPPRSDRRSLDHCMKSGRPCRWSTRPPRGIYRRRTASRLARFLGVLRRMPRPSPEHGHSRAKQRPRFCRRRKSQPPGPKSAILTYGRHSDICRRRLHSRLRGAGQRSIRRNRARDPQTQGQGQRVEIRVVLHAITAPRSRRPAAGLLATCPLSITSP